MRSPCLSAVAVALLLNLSHPAAAADIALTCDPAASRIEVVVHATVDSFTAHLQAFSPAITCDEAGRITAARLKFRFADLKTGKDRRDAAMLEWEEATRYPDAEFALDSLTPSAGSAWQARGHLTLHGQSRPVAFPVSIVGDPPGCVIEGEVPLDTREYGLPVIRMLGLLKVDPLVRVRFHLQGAGKKSA